MKQKEQRLGSCRLGEGGTVRPRGIHCVKGFGVLIKVVFGCVF